MFDNIVAISSGAKVNQAISIIRLSGPDVFEIMKKIFTGKVGKDKSITYGYIKNDQEIIDEVLVMWFKGPNNFVGEDTVEINAHGGIVVSTLILETIVANGARLAEPGEFSKRAFLNGKLDLVKAEAINDLIHSKTVQQAKINIKKFDRKTSMFINDLINKLVFIIGTCEVNIDYPEYDDIEELTLEVLLPKLKDLEKEISKAVELSERSRIYFNEIPIAIVGRPNVGKSSLLNALLEEDKSIVTNIEGTTRDVVEARFVLNGINFLLKDTAGIRHSENVIEKIGIEKSFKQIQDSEIIIHLVLENQDEDDFERKIKELSEGKKYIRVINKKDLISKDKIKKDQIYISALKGEISELEKAILFEYQNIDLDDFRMIQNTRQLALIKSSLFSIQEAIKGLEQGYTPDVVIVDITKAWENLVNIVGRADNEKLLDSMFSNFCLGK
ncbi:tRNA uridine-5-carboxymethylaminomethyl(34) synthesis GTPase MnmE [Mycoplasmopsis pulmonis]|uniref:tRNA uridine-5-carboxymethylaminomethyl(34) synthesis GTPase MnmE n=1 Tax=Mycoplasmopsis pulmonis TaxID=2107 RepID=UPI002ACDF7A5|nr:tRNA uridine-5-carboxymethylaminomethyl(34) synthesis GTPase MnmE [Mycoplasmopsis pulmonis]MDZ7293363.1 tRNA uridine-5-carboxymethylaminomethyl(34) synthesis GTPase MnmE [Mycoplasmopsis pulmonis]